MYILRFRVRSLTNQLNYLQKHMNEIIERKVDAAVKTVTKEFENKVISLESQVQHLKSVLNNDSTNSSLPTSRTPINKNKKIPNSIEKTNKKAGGQSGHTKHTLKQFDDNEIDEIIQHRIEECPICHSSMKDTEHIRIKNEYYCQKSQASVYRNTMSTMWTYRKDENS